MVFKSKLFFSSKKSRSSSPSSSNSPRSVGSDSPIRSDKKKPKSNSKEETRSPNTKKHVSAKGKEASLEVHSSSPGKSNSSSSGSEAKKPITETPATSDVKEESPASVSPIMASSLGLNRIKTRSGPLPQESFFSFENDYAIPVLPCYKLSKLDTGKKEAGSSKVDIGPLRCSNPALLASGTGMTSDAQNSLDHVVE